MTRILLDVPRSLDDVHEAVAAHPAIPDHYGRNLDALSDVLGDVQDVVVVWRGVRTSVAAMGADAARLGDVLRDATVANPGVMVAYVW